MTSSESLGDNRDSNADFFAVVEGLELSVPTPRTEPSSEPVYRHPDANAANPTLSSDQHPWNGQDFTSY